MFELRWLEKETGRQLQNDWGYFYMETVKVLQYRKLVSTPEYKEDGVLTINKWSDWMDVPIHVESTGAIK
jgi:hypothetical protein